MSFSQALMMVASYVRFDGRYGDGDAQHLVLFKGDGQARFEVKSCAAGYAIVRFLVGDDRRLADDIMKKHPRFKFYSESSFCSYTADELVYIVNACLPHFVPGKPYTFSNVEDTNKTYEQICKYAGI